MLTFPPEINGQKVNFKMNVVLASDKAKPPTKGSPRSAGYDLYSAENMTVPAGGSCLISTDIRVSIKHNLPPNMGIYLKIFSRSGLATKGISVQFGGPYDEKQPSYDAQSHPQLEAGAGVIDEDYTGIIKIKLINGSNQDYPVKQGDKIAQMIPHIVAMIEEDNICIVEKLDETERGNQGFGSTGN